MPSVASIFKDIKSLSDRDMLELFNRIGGLDVKSIQLNFKHKRL